MICTYPAFHLLGFQTVICRFIYKWTQVFKFGSKVSNSICQEQYKQELLKTHKLIHKGDALLKFFLHLSSVFVSFPPLENYPNHPSKFTTSSFFKVFLAPVNTVQCLLLFPYHLHHIVWWVCFSLSLSISRSSISSHLNPLERKLSLIKLCKQTTCAQTLLPQLCDLEYNP